MAFIPAPNVVQVEIRSLNDGQKIENRLFVDVFHEPLQSDLDALAGAVSAAVSTQWVPRMPSTWVCTEFFLRSMHTANSIQSTYPQPASSFTGTGGGAALPNNVSLCVSLRTGNAGRSARGRLYWQALMEPDVAENTVGTSAVVGITNAVSTLRSNILALGYAWIICSFIANGVPRPGGPVYFPVTSILVVDPVVDSMRRRLPGRGT